MKEFNSKVLMFLGWESQMLMVIGWFFSTDAGKRVGVDADTNTGTPHLSLSTSICGRQN